MPKGPNVLHLNPEHVVPTLIEDYHWIHWIMSKGLDDSKTNPWTRTCYLNPRSRPLVDFMKQAQRPRRFHLNGEHTASTFVQDHQQIQQIKPKSPMTFPSMGTCCSSICLSPPADSADQAQWPQRSPPLVENTLLQPSFDTSSAFDGSSLNALMTPQLAHKQEQAVKPWFRIMFKLIGSSSQVSMVLSWSRTHYPNPWLGLE